MNRKSLALGAIFVGGLSIGGVVAAQVIGSPAVSAVSGAAPVAFAQDSADPAATADAPVDRPSPFADVLAGLVSDGTLTQEQADKVEAALQAARPMHDGPGMGGHHRGGPGTGAPGQGQRGARLEVVATALGATADELRTALQAGRTIADVAADKGVDVQTVIDALVAEAKDHMAQAVSAGRITQAEADAHLAEVEQRVTEMVDNPLPARGPGGMGGPGRPGGPPAPADGAPVDDATTTTGP